jgi:hypothetical protein
VVARVGKGLPTPSREDMASNMVQVENNLEGYWCKGEKCMSSSTHWVLHSSETICWDCWHNPCACLIPLEWDEAEQAYYFFFLCDGKTKNNIWLSEPASDLVKISYKRKEKKQRDNMRKRKEEEECANNQ